MTCLLHINNFLFGWSKRRGLPLIRIALCLLVVVVMVMKMMMIMVLECHFLILKLDHDGIVYHYLRLLSRFPVLV